jgi:DnaJ domain
MSTQREEWLSALELPVDASPAEIDEAWRQLVQVWHPDRFGHNRPLQLRAEERLKQINEAHRNLLTTVPPSGATGATADPTPGVTTRAVNEEQAPSGYSGENRVVQCPHCGGVSRISVRRDSNPRIRCPHCSKVFALDGTSDQATSFNGAVPHPASLHPPRAGSSKMGRMLIKAGWAMGLGAVLLLPLVGSLVNQDQTKTLTTSSPSVSQQSPSSLPSGTEWRDRTTAAAPSSGTVAPPSSFADDLNAVRSQPDRGDATATKYGGVRVSKESANRALDKAKPKSVWDEVDRVLATPPASGRRTAGQFSPEDIDHIDSLVRPTTGYEWPAPSNSTGRGELSVTNGTAKDGVAVLFERLNDDSVRARQAVYVRAREDARIHGIAPGSYTLRFMLGVDWDDSGRVFRRSVECYAFVDALDFTETTTDDRVVYSEQSVTLHKVINGNARSTTVRPAMVRFDELLRIQQP